MTLETRLDSEWTDQISTLVGLFYSNEATRANVTDTISLVHPVLGPISIVRNTVRSEEHTSELQSLMRISSAVFCLNNKKLITILYSHPAIHVTKYLSVGSHCPYSLLTDVLL